jgi:hypothetical protein
MCRVSISFPIGNSGPLLTHQLSRAGFDRPVIARLVLPGHHMLYGLVLSATLDRAKLGHHVAGVV